MWCEWCVGEGEWVRVRVSGVWVSEGSGVWVRCG